MDSLINLSIHSTLFHAYCQTFITFRKTFPALPGSPRDVRITSPTPNSFLVSWKVTDDICLVFMFKVDIFSIKNENKSMSNSFEDEHDIINCSP